MRRTHARVDPDDLQPGAYITRDYRLYEVTSVHDSGQIEIHDAAAPLSIEHAERVDVKDVCKTCTLVRRTPLDLRLAKLAELERHYGPRVRRIHDGRTIGPFVNALYSRPARHDDIVVRLSERLHLIEADGTTTKLGADGRPEESSL
jgi:hypothetical protein